VEEKSKNLLSYLENYMETETTVYRRVVVAATRKTEQQ